MYTVLRDVCNFQEGGKPQGTPFVCRFGHVVNVRQDQNERNMSWELKLELNFESWELYNEKQKNFKYNK